MKIDFSSYRWSSVVIILSIVAAPICLADDLYKIEVKRLDTNLYKDVSSGVIIKTKYCYEYTYGDPAILKYGRYSYDNKLIFTNSGTSCEVETVVK